MNFETLIVIRWAGNGGYFTDWGSDLGQGRNLFSLATRFLNFPSSIVLCVAEIC
jgi:hypothetical protein